MSNLISANSNGERLNLNDLLNVSGGVIGVSINDACHKGANTFQPLSSKEEEWEKDGCPKNCTYCWNLKFNNGFYCDA
ncbi:MAG: hypothetical protein IJ758_03865 [Clostridia bacterium]|nr:hypothetical protein [Clostridia bacterium]